MPENKTLHSRNEEIVTQFFDFVELHLQNLLKCNDAKSPYIRNQKKLGESWFYVCSNDCVE